MSICKCVEEETLQSFKHRCLGPFNKLRLLKISMESRQIKPTTYVRSMFSDF